MPRQQWANGSSKGSSTYDGNTFREQCAMETIFVNDAFIILYELDNVDSCFFFVHLLFSLAPPIVSHGG